MLLTVTYNSALDRVLFIDEFRPTTTMRPHKMVEGVGGKGFDASVVLQTLGVDNLALGFVAGQTGRQLVSLLDGYGVKHDLVWVEGETRIAHVIAETAHHRHSHIIAAGLSVPAVAYRTFLAGYETHLDQAAGVIAGGSLAGGVPVTAYHDLIELAEPAGILSLIDSFGQPVLETLSMPPTILKMNQAEFGQTFEQPASSLEELQVQGRAVRDRYHLPALVITCGLEGMLAFTPTGTYRAIAPVQQTVNAAGAGDGASAALVWRLLQGDDWVEALRWAAATGAAIVLTENTADCNMVDIERILAETEVQVNP